MGCGDPGQGRLPLLPAARGQEAVARGCRRAGPGGTAQRACLDLVRDVRTACSIPALCKMGKHGRLPQDLEQGAASDAQGDLLSMSMASQSGIASNNTRESVILGIEVWSARDTRVRARMRESAPTPVSEQAEQGRPAQVVTVVTVVNMVLAYVTLVGLVVVKCARTVAGSSGPAA